MRETPVRRDAARNRERLLRAARTVVAQHGPEVSLDEIARAAGVSRTTLHRHFVDRESLAAAVLEDNVEEIEARARDLSSEADGAVQLFHHVLDVQIDAPWLAQMVARKQARELADLGDRTRAAFEPLMERAREEGLAHPGTTAEDVLGTLPMLLGALAVEARAGGGAGAREAEAAEGAAVHARGGLGVERSRVILHRGLFTTAPPER